ncbi:MAG TPA: DUF4185 domain-containing protein [Candidatus Acidoferrales bacterium]|nr:DUF4185 domain-containing protein [Candidatus Acidoferrales bacterium]
MRPANRYSPSRAARRQFRARSLTRAAISFVVLTLAAVSGISYRSAISANPPSRRPAPSAPELIIASATDIGTLETSPKIRGRDGAYSALFDGHYIWLYGDTFLEHKNEKGRLLISNSWSFADERSSAPTRFAGFRERLDKSAQPTMLLPETSEETVYNDSHDGEKCRVKPCGARFALWPGAMVPDPDRHRLLMFYSLIAAQPGDFNFHSLGNSVAIWNDFSAKPLRPHISPIVVAAHPELLFDQHETNFGSSAFIAQGMLYVYSYCEGPSGKPCRLARVDPARVLDRSAWSYWSVNRWSPNIADASPIFTGNDIMNVSFNPFLGRYVAIYSQELSQRDGPHRAGTGRTVVG